MSMQMYPFRTIYKSCVKKEKVERMQSCFRNFTKKKKTTHSGKGTEMWSKKEARSNQSDKQFRLDKGRKSKTRGTGKVNEPGNQSQYNEGLPLVNTQSGKLLLH